MFLHPLQLLSFVSCGLCYAEGGPYRKPDVTYSTVGLNRTWVHCCVAKSGSTTFKALVRDKANAGTPCSASKPRCAPGWAAPAAPAGRPPVACYGCEWSGCPEASAIFRSTVVRSPYSRFVSMVKDKFLNRAPALAAASAANRLSPCSSKKGPCKDTLRILRSAHVPHADIIRAFAAPTIELVASLISTQVTKQCSLLLSLDRHARPFVHQCHLDEVKPELVGRTEDWKGFLGALVTARVLDMHGVTIAVLASRYHMHKSRRRLRRSLAVTPGGWVGRTGCDDRVGGGCTNNESTVHASNQTALEKQHVCTLLSAATKAMIDSIYEVDFKYIQANALYTEEELWPCRDGAEA
ncbi:hypothetical protein T492DRAFT_1040812 [Pavlovales sp. CCMP2436]|nr:hypothetical protein T492DRAFT_1040812 [Pavlovales sp. CCMP2436]